MGKKKKKKYLDAYEKYDYSDINYDGNIPKMMKDMAEGLEAYIDYLSYMIMEGIAEDEFKDAIDQVKKLIKNLKKGDPDIFNNNELNESIEQDRMLVIGK